MPLSRLDISMAIKDRDGNVYKLRGPNPLVKDMSDWNKDAVKLINHYGSKEEVVQDSRNPIKAAKENIVDISNELQLYQGPEKSKPVPAAQFIEEIAEPVTETTNTVESIPVQTTSEPDSVTIHVDEKIGKILKERGTEFYCAPVIGQKVWKDELYGTSYTTNKYGTKFIFDGIIIGQSDLEIQFWCMRDLCKDSIILRKNQQGGERWWRVSQTESKSGGLLCKAIISDLNPDFS